MMKLIALLSLCSLIQTSDAFAGQAVIFSGNDVKALKSNLDLNGSVKVLSGSVDPSSSATAGNPGSLYLNSSTGQVYRKADSGSTTNWKAILSGQQGGINYVTNPDAEASVTGFSAYADAAGVAPVDGTGGSPTVTITRTTSSPLRGLGSFLITKDAANRQGEGVSTPFTIDLADQAKPLSIRFDYQPSSGFVSGDSSDLRVWVYDVTNAVLIPVAPYTIQGGSANQHLFKGVFQTASNSTSYRLICHVATTNAAAWTLKLDNVQVGPESVSYGPPVTDWTSYTPTFTGFGTVSVQAFEYKRIGDDLYIRGKFTAGTSTATLGKVSFPSGLVSSASIHTAENGGVYYRNSNGGVTSNPTGGIILQPSISYVLVSDDFNVALNYLDPTNATNMSASGDVISIVARVPIQGWSSTLLMSNDTDTRVVAAQATGNPASASSGNPIIFPTSVYDTHGAYSAATGRYTAPVSGFYRVHGFLPTANAAVLVNLYTNAVLGAPVCQTDSNGQCAFTGTVQVKAGDVVDIRPNGTLDATGGTIQFERISGPSAIAATETVAAKYYGATASVGVSYTDLSFSTKDNDSHGLYSSPTATIPVSGRFAFSGSISVAASVATSAEVCVSLFNATTSAVASGGEICIADPLTSSVSIPFNFRNVQAVAGTQFKLQVKESGLTGASINASDTLNVLQIERTGNY